jgi:hypothetical protein
MNLAPEVVLFLRELAQAVFGNLFSYSDVVFDL